MEEKTLHNVEPVDRDLKLDVKDIEQGVINTEQVISNKEHVVDNTKLTNGESLSKRQKKKAEKRRVWLDSKAERRKEEKERRKKKMARVAEERGGFPESRSSARKRIKKEQVPMSKSECKIGVIFDMQFDHLMHQRDLGKCIKQILRCYSNNRRLKAPLQMYMTSFKGKVEEEMNKHNGYKQWDMHFKPESFSEILPLESLVYLSGDSNNSINTLEQGKNYVIGGLVDHNNHKGICLRKAEELGIQHGRLPIDAFLEMKTRHVLAVNHVYEILAQYTQNQDWKSAFLSTIPGRKGVSELVEDDLKHEEEKPSETEK